MSQTNFPTRKLGNNGPTVSAIGFGAMGALIQSTRMLHG